VVTHIEPDILEGKVKWALGTITKNKASGGDRMRRWSVNQESLLWTTSSPEALEDDQEQRSRQLLIFIKRQRV